MRQFLLIFFAVIVLGLFSCNKNDNNNSGDWPNAGSDTETSEQILSSASSSGDDIDAWLEDYEKLVKEYIKFNKKAAELADSHDFAEYAQLLSSPELRNIEKLSKDLDQKIKDKKDEMTPKQRAKFMEVQMNLLKASQELLSKKTNH